jgi:hypothetical protein
MRKLGRTEASSTRPMPVAVPLLGLIMDLIADLAARSLLLFGFLLFACQMVAHKLGYFLGRRGRAAGRDENVKSVGLVVNSLFSLLAFTLALTLSFASSRYAERRAGVLTEAKALGTAWSRAEAIGHPLGHEIASLLKQYTPLRRDYVLASRGSPAIVELNGRAADLQTQMWTRLSSIVRERPDNVSSSLMASLNDAFDAGMAERFAIETTMPPQLFWLLIGLIFVSMATFGYRLGLSGDELRTLLVILTVVWTAVLVVILDLSTPRIGAARTSSTVYDWALESMAGERPHQSSSR